MTEEIVLKLARSIAQETGERNLCLAGGVALNCVANGKLLRDRAYSTSSGSSPPPAMRAGRVGAALAAHHIYLRKPRPATEWRGRDAGRVSRAPSIRRATSNDACRPPAPRFAVLSDDRAHGHAAQQELANNKALGWHQGRMEFGPRALGARSILGDARSPTMQKLLNLKVKYRESFRPFAPVVLIENVSDWFDLDRESPYMLLVADVAQPHRRGDDTGAAAAVRHRQAERRAVRLFPPSLTSITRHASRPCIARRIRASTSSSAVSRR